MADELTFTPPKTHRRGTVFSLLQRAWAPIWNRELEAKIRDYDEEVYDYPYTVGACAFITCLNNEPIGMASYDPTQAPELVVIGWNCIVPEHQNKMYGRKQIQELLRIFRMKGYQVASATTSEESFYLPAKQMYHLCNFIEHEKKEGKIEFRLHLQDA